MGEREKKDKLAADKRKNGCSEKETHGSEMKGREKRNRNNYRKNRRKTTNQKI